MDKESFYRLLREALTDREQEEKTGGNLQDKQLEKCPSEDVFSYYLGLGLSSSDKERIEGHIASCSHCRHLLITLAMLENERKESPAAEVLSTTLRTIEEKISISLAWAKDRLIVQKTNIESFRYWQAVTSALMPSRGEAAGEKGKLPPFTQSFPKCKVTLKVRGEADGTCELYCCILPNTESEDMGSSLTVDLIRAGRRFRSSSLKNQSVLFERIEPGNYILIVRENETQCAEIALTINPGPGE